MLLATVEPWSESLVEPEEPEELVSICFGYGELPGRLILKKINSIFFLDSKRFRVLILWSLSPNCKAEGSLAFVTSATCQIEPHLVNQLYLDWIRL
jgi:hypothetical protein